MWPRRESSHRQRHIRSCAFVATDTCKAKSSRRVRCQFPSEGAFAWQAGCGASKLSRSTIKAVKSTVISAKWTRI